MDNAFSEWEGTLEKKKTEKIDCTLHRPSFEYSISTYALPHILLLLKYTSSNNISAAL